jgi:hypothetical protein
MMISFYRIAIALILIATLSGCSSFNNNEPEYIASVELPALKVPEGMDSPTSATPVIIKGNKIRLPSGDELEPLPPRVVSTAGKQDANAYMSWSAEGAYLMVKDTPDSVTRRLRFAIQNSGMEMLETNDSGSHKFHYTQPRRDDEGFFSNMAFWRDRPLDYSGIFMTSLQADDENTRVYLLFGNGVPVDTRGAEHILGIFMDRLG